MRACAARLTLSSNPWEEPMTNAISPAPLMARSAIIACLLYTSVYNVLLAAGIQPGRDVLIQTQSRSEVSPYIEF